MTPSTWIPIDDAAKAIVTHADPHKLQPFDKGAVHWVRSGDRVDRAYWRSAGATFDMQAGHTNQYPAQWRREDEGALGFDPVEYRP